MIQISNEIRERSPDLVFLGVLIICLLLALGGIRSGWSKRESMLSVSGGREIDVAKVRKQITEGSLSQRKASFFKRVTQ